MTQAEKAMAYDEALERARKLKENPQSVFNEYSSKEGDTICDYIFPELKESEDEKIKHEIKVVLANTDLSQFALEYTFADMLAWLEKQGKQNTNHKTMIVKFICKKDWHGIGDYYYGKIYNGYPCEKEQKGYDIYDDNNIPTFCDEDFIDEYFNIITEEKQGEQKPIIEMKSAKESLGIDSETYNKIVDECIYGDDKQKSAWGEVDDDFFNDIIAFLKDTKNALDHVDWIKSLKQRICG